MAELDYFFGQGDIESNPHNNVHVDIGGWMGSVPTAAQDPVFYVHHSNIDRLLEPLAGPGRRTPRSPQRRHLEEHYLHFLQ